LADLTKKKAALSSNEDAKPLPGMDAWLKKIENETSVWNALQISDVQTSDHPSVDVLNNEIISTSWDLPELPGKIVIKGSGDFPAKITALQLDLLSIEEDLAKPADLTEKIWLAFDDVRVIVHHKDGSSEQSRLDYHSRAGDVKPTNFADYRILREKLVIYKGYERRIGNRFELQGDKVGLHLVEALNWNDGDTLEIQMDLAWDDGLPGSELPTLPSTRINVTGTKDLGPDPIGIVAKSKAAKTDEEKAEVRKYYQTFSTKALELGRADYEAEYALMEYSEVGARTWVTTRMEEPRITKILPLGDWTNDNGEIVEPAVPAFLGKIEKEDGIANRLDLANWLVSDENPLTARVTVNRFWKQFFGVGLSNILNDLGSQGEWPTHPELLDWLAVEFVDSGWDMKHMIRLMVTSSSYKQSSFVTADARDLDPLNRYYARQSQIRLPAEIIRDNALAIADLLVPTVGGRSVRPYQPEGYLSDLAFPRRVWTPDMDENQYRRGLYTFWQRTRVHPALQAFDAPTRQDAVADRPSSNTPLQALVLLNNPSFVEAARVFGENIMASNGDVDAKLVWAFEKAIARPTLSQMELDKVREVYNDSLEYFTENTSEADDMLDIGLRPLAGDVDKAELAAWTSVARLIINMHETVTRF
ncbi:MAG: DUF1553 domain-containing protein, partial [Kordiimonadaceae bacterium]|nr:DUF1553 domain-containing protein [Kordiimonadaceae bacterium]